MRHPDPWDARPPLMAELSREELREFLDVARRNPGAFSDWDADFCASCRQRLRWGSLSPKQEAILDRGLLQRLWNHDPDLWKDP